MTTMRQRAAARRNIKKAQAALRRRGRRSRRSSRASANGGSRTPGFAATYQQGKTAMQILSPVSDPVLSIADGASLDNVRGALESRVKNRGFLREYAKGAFVSVLDAWGSRKIRHANALSSRSVTAAAPEIYALGTAILDNDLDPRDTHADFIATTSGFDPQRGSFSTKGKLRTYLTLKYGGKGVRWAANTVPPVGKPLKKALNMLGLTL